MHKHPALLYAIAAIIGTAAALVHWSYLFLILLFPFALPRTLLIAAACFLIALARIQLPVEDIEGEGYFSITALTDNHSAYGSGWIYRGTLITFEGGRNIPVSIALPGHLNRPIANKDYLVKGILKPTASGHFMMKISPEDPWIPIDGTYSLAEGRYHAKQTVAKKIEQTHNFPDTISFLTGIATGEFDDPLLQFEFSRFGLQHIMAISGFHFSLIAAFLTFVLRAFLSQRMTTIAMIILMSAYFLFLGPGPSVLRAFCTTIIALMSTLIRRTTTGVNALAVATLILLLYDPLLLTTIGFPFSALTTASILLFYPRFDRLLEKIFQQRYLHEALHMHTLEKFAYCTVQLIRQSLALTLAVNIIAIPLTLFFFGRFPALSLIYNLFFPFLVSLSMMLLLATLALPPLAPLLSTINDYLTHGALALASNLPTRLDVNIYSPHIGSLELITILAALFYLSLLEEKHSIRQYVQLQWRS